MTYDDIYPYLASTYDFSPENMIFPLKHLFQKDGKRYLMAENRLVGHNIVTYDDMSILRRFGNFSFFHQINGKANPLVFF